MRDDIQRRRFLQAMAACLALSGSAVSAAASSSAPDPLVLNDFLKASSELTGLKLSSHELALTYLDVLRARFTQADLDALLAASRLEPQAFSMAVAQPPLKTLTQEAILLWLTGFTTDAATGTVQVLAYTEAAVWDALAFTKPPGQCGGAFGYWSDAPSRT